MKFKQKVNDMRQVVMQISGIDMVLHLEAYFIGVQTSYVLENSDSG